MMRFAYAVACFSAASAALNDDPAIFGENAETLVQILYVVSAVGFSALGIATCFKGPIR